MSEYKEIIVKEYHNDKGLITRREIGEELVRCKYCKWWNGNDCEARDIDVVDVDDYCSYGEREDGDEHECK